MNVSYTVNDHIALVTIDNPPMNPLDRSVMDGIRDTFNTLVQDETIRAVIITGVGRSFVAGADIKEFASWTPNDAEDLTSKGHRIFSLIENFPVPVIAAVNGFALGGGLELALACDLRIASEKAKFGFPEVTLGIIPGYGGTQRLCRTIPIGKAKKMIYLAEIIDAAEAEKIGLVDAVASPENLNEAALDMARKIAANAPIAVRGAKEAITKGRNVSIEQGLAVELLIQRQCFSSEDKKEGADAFINKRKPVFQNR